MQRVAVILALAGVLLRGAIPAGFMPAFGDGAARGAWLMLCDGGEHQHMAMDMSMPGMDHHDEAPQSALHSSGECPYAAAAISAPPSPPFQFTLALLGDDLVTPAWPIDPASSGLQHLRPPLRGPPLIS